MVSFHSRGLAALELNSSTARVLNLNKIYEIAGKNNEYKLYPFFHNKILNRSIIVKHKLSSSEIHDYHELRPICTKLVIPIDTNNLKLGVYYVFVGQKDFMKILGQKLNKKEKDIEEDIRRLNLIDSMVSLDPFVISECFKNNNIHISQLYFVIDQEIKSSIEAFIEEEVSPLIKMTFNEDKNSKYIVKKILSKSVEIEQISEKNGFDIYSHQIIQNFQSLKTILYYKWKMKYIYPKTLQFASDLIKFIPKANYNSGVNLHRLKMGTFVNLYKLLKELQDTSDQYDESFQNNINQKNPELFLKFLSNAPNVLKIIAERVDALDHVIGFWRLLVPHGTRPNMNHYELAELLSDFESNLRVENQ